MVHGRVHMVTVLLSMVKDITVVINEYKKKDICYRADLLNDNNIYKLQTGIVF